VDCVAYVLDVEGVVVMLGVEVLEADVVVVVVVAEVDEAPDVVSVDERRRGAVDCVIYDRDIEGVEAVFEVEMLDVDVIVVFVVEEVDEVIDTVLDTRPRCRLVDCVAYDLDVEGVVVMLGVEVLEVDVVVVVAVAEVGEVPVVALVDGRCDCVVDSVACNVDEPGTSVVVVDDPLSQDIDKSSQCMQLCMPQPLCLQSLRSSSMP